MTQYTTHARLVYCSPHMADNVCSGNAEPSARPADFMSSGRASVCRFAMRRQSSIVVACCGTLQLASLLAALTLPVCARKTLWPKNPYHIAAVGTGPSVLLGSSETSYAEFPYVLKVFNHTHTILGSIGLIQMLQAGTRKAGAPGAVLHATGDYRVVPIRLVFVMLPAAVFIPEKVKSA
jgi:hypothetical protein